MSTDGEFECNDHAPDFSDVEVLNAFIDHDDLPRGSEGPLTYFYLHNTIVFDSNLRDRGWNDDIGDTRSWFQRIIANSFVTKAYAQLNAGGFFICGFYYINDVFSEIKIPDGFIELDENK